MLSRFPRSSLFYFALVVVLGLIFWFTWSSIQNGQNQTDWTYSQLIDKAQAGQVTDLEINGTDGVASETGGKKHNVQLPDCSSGCSQLLTEMQTDKVNVKFDKSQTGSYLISVLLPNIILVILIAAFMWWVLRQTQSGNNQAMSFGRSRARMIAGDKPAITFADVAGVDEAKQELSEIVEFLKYPEKFVALGARIQKGVLLVGPPGSGKPLLSKAVAGEAGVPFFSISGSAFVEMFVGLGAARVRDLFQQARLKAPCLIFIDELDALGKSRDHGHGSHEEREHTLNQLLVEMDGFDTRSGVVVLAATNRPEILDAALLRPGRFDRHVAVSAPDRKGRLAILDVHARKVSLAPEVKLEAIAGMTPGMSGADLANMVNEAALLAARHDGTSVGPRDFDEAIERVVAGLEKK